MADKETIEAKLCAYVDDELTPSERAEIEQHLASNPGHQALMEQLRLTRLMMSDLPRAQAPEEIIEAVQGQLERDSLLLYADKELYPTESHRWRWPQFTLIAAMLALALGLAFVVLSALPTTHPASFAVNVDPSLNSARQSETPDVMADGGIGAAERRNDLAKGSEPSVPVPMSKGGVAAVISKQSDDVAKRPQVVMVIASAESPKATMRVVEVLTSRQLAWRAAMADSTVLADLSPGKSLEEMGIAGPSFDGPMNRALANAKGAQTPWRGPEAGITNNVFNVEPLPPVAQAMAGGNEQAAPAAPATPVAKSANRDEPQPAANADSVPGSGQAAGLPEQQVNQDGTQQAGILAQAQTQPDLAMQQAKVVDSIGGDAAITQGFASAREYVVEDISQDQALLIMRAIAADSSVSLARVYQSPSLEAEPAQARVAVAPNAANASVAPTQEPQSQEQELYPQQTTIQRSVTGQMQAQQQLRQRELDARAQLPQQMATSQPAAGMQAEMPIRIGQELVIEIAELKGTGLEPVTHARVRADGTVVVPTLEPVKAEGLTIAQLQQQVSKEFASVNLIANPTVKVSSVEGTDGGQAIQQQVGMQQAIQTAPSQAVDLTIVVQSRPDLQQTPVPADDGRWVVNGNGPSPTTMEAISPTLPTEANTKDATEPTPASSDPLTTPPGSQLNNGVNSSAVDPIPAPAVATPTAPATQPADR